MPLNSTVKSPANGSIRNCTRLAAERQRFGNGGSLRLSFAADALVSLSLTKALYSIIVSRLQSCEHWVCHYQIEMLSLQVSLEALVRDYHLNTSLNHSSPNWAQNLVFGQ